MSVHNEIRLYSARQADCRVQLRHVNHFVIILLQVGVVPFDKALIVPDVVREKEWDLESCY